MHGMNNIKFITFFIGGNFDYSPREPKIPNYASANKADSTVPHSFSLQILILTSQQALHASPSPSIRQACQHTHTEFSSCGTLLNN
jgi:hypothetical protein